jgi:hypothetical protein
MTARKCSFEEEKIITASYGDGGIVNKVRVFLHTKKCRACASLYREYRQSALLFDSIKPEKCPATVIDKVEKQIGIKQNKKRRLLDSFLDFIFYRPDYALPGTAVLIILAGILTFTFSDMYSPDPGIYYSTEEINQAQKAIETAFAVIVPAVYNAQITVRDNIIRSQVLPPVKHSVEQTNKLFHFAQ